MVRQPVLYPRMHPWYLALAAADVLLTWLIISSFYGVEVNPLAAAVIETGGMSLATFYKFLLVAFVMWACEYIGRHRPATGRRVLAYAVGINMAVVLFSLGQLAAAAM